jgi:hypothetical protein
MRNLRRGKTRFYRLRAPSADLRAVRPRHALERQRRAGGVKPPEAALAEAVGFFQQAALAIRTTANVARAVGVTEPD